MGNFLCLFWFNGFQLIESNDLMVYGIEFICENVKENQGLSFVDGIKIIINYVMSISIRLKDLDEKYGF